MLAPVVYFLGATGSCLLREGMGILPCLVWISAPGVGRPETGGGN